MSPQRIQVLPEHIANRIAAGEIIERPASVVRELLDNAIDAGATRIETEIRDGGKVLIAVKDNGCGIAPDDLLLAFERHATSKIASVEDLDTIHTLGFRGEALPSIASVSRMMVESYARGARVGARLRIEAGRIIDMEEAPCPPGTRFVVRQLFYNVPARRKFLRSSKTEYGHIYETILDHALAHPGIHFVFRDGERTVMDSPAVDKWAARLTILLGKSMYASMLNVSAETDEISVEGYIAAPEHLQATARSQRLYVNNRRVRDRIITQAVYRGYREFISANRHPAYVLKVDIAPERVDVNVHPSKSEVRFREPGVVFDVVSNAVSAALSRSLKRTFSAPASEVLPKAEKREVPGAPAMPSPAPHRQAQPESYPAPSGPPGGAPSETHPRDESFPETQVGNIPDGPEATFPDGGFPQVAWRVVGQVFKTFIFVEFGEEVLIIDQHTAHERILFEQFRKAYKNRAIASQRLMFPVTVELEPNQFVVLSEYQAVLRDMGVDVEEFGHNTFIVRALPEHLRKEPPALLLKNIANELLETGASDRNKAAERKLLMTLACHRAIRAGDALDKQKMEALVSDLMRLNLPATCPHGRPIIIKIPRSEIHRRFLR